MKRYVKKKNFTAYGSIFPNFLPINTNVCIVMASTRLDELICRSVIRSSADRCGEDSSFRSKTSEKSDPEALCCSSLRTCELFSCYAAHVPVTSWPRYLQSSSGTDVARSSLCNCDDY